MRKGTESGKFNPLWSEAIGRANIIKAHLRIDKASVADADADAAATALVLKRRDFYHLVRVF